MPKQKTIDLAIPRSYYSLSPRAFVESFLAVFCVATIPLLFAHHPQNQFVVGPIVNTILFLTCLRLGIMNALFIAIIPSMAALFGGMLPPQAITILPFIVLGNFAMLISFFFLKTNPYGKVFLSSLLKAAVVFSPLLVGVKVPAVLVFMLSWPQFLTALLGGFIAVKINNFLKVRQR